MQRRIGLLRYARPLSRSGAPSLNIPVVDRAEASTQEISSLQATHPFVVVFSSLGTQSQRSDTRDLDSSPKRPAVQAEIRQGPLQFPVLRIDDYPTAIRPLLEDRTPIRNVLADLDSQDVPYILGVSPGLLDRSDVEFLRTLQHMVPAVHGLDHNYFRFASELMKSGDLYNKKTMHGFAQRVRNKLTPTHQSEFSGLHPRIALDRLRLAKDRLEEAARCPVNIFTATFDRPPPSTAYGLEKLGFLAYLSQRPVKNCVVPWLKSDFYGQSDGFDPEQGYAAPCLHTLWEWDLVREKGSHQFGVVGEYVRAVRRDIEDARSKIAGALIELGVATPSDVAPN